MPRKAKEKIVEIVNENEIKKAEKTAKKRVSKKADSNTSEAVNENQIKKASITVKSSAVEENTTAPKKRGRPKKQPEAVVPEIVENTAKIDDVTSTPTVKKKTSSKTSTTKKETTKLKTTSTSASTRKRTTTKKASTETSTKKRTSKKKIPTEEISNELTSNIHVLEYYDLPYKYDSTIVKLLAQTPKTLFVYWEISESDINNFKEKYGDDFFINTNPILIVHNRTLNKTTEVEINDFANCWYLNTEDSDCKFDIELARKFIKSYNIQSAGITEKNVGDKYVYIAQSNSLQSPNDHILFEKLTNEVTFRNAITHKTTTKHIRSFSFLNDIYKFYKNMYADEFIKNPSSKI